DVQSCYLRLPARRLQQRREHAYGGGKYTGDPESFSWAVKAAAGVRVFMSGGPKAPTDNDFLRQVEGVVRAGGTGVAVGRNVWQNQDPLAMAGKLGKAIFG
ncbi:MAG: hypothetical protein JRN35_04015, partial [Nitrososphaerota archaeon]|nr:hypothetical protein [Nitrososphaerota archaeon]